jgi:hypothetical protein
LLEMRGEPKPIVTSVRRYAADRDTQYRQNPHIDIKRRLGNGQSKLVYPVSLLQILYYSYLPYQAIISSFLGFPNKSCVTRAILTDIEPGPSPELHIFGLSTLIDSPEGNCAGTE